MSFYSDVRTGDMQAVMALLMRDPSPMAMLDRFLAEVTQADMREVLTDLRADMVAYQASGKTMEVDSLSRIAYSSQGIEDRPLATVQVSSDYDGIVLRLEESGTIV